MKCIASTCIRESNNYIDGGDCDDNVNDSDRSQFFWVFLQSNKKKVKKEKNKNVEEKEYQRVDLEVTKREKEQRKNIWRERERNPQMMMLSSFIK